VAKKEKPFNNPFVSVKLPPKPDPEKPPPPQQRRDEPPPAPRPRPDAALTEDELWTLAVDGANPLADRSSRIKPPPPKLSLAPQPLDPDLVAYDELRAFVTGEVPFEIEGGDEFIEGHARGLDLHLVHKLKRGDFSVQAHVDLHGLLKDEAKTQLEAFLLRSRQQGKRCVLVVTGRGLHSKDQVPVLKEALKRWMSTARFARHVLAFATARPHDGGSGAVYVLLKRS
jgi:DNA-nicking Smr family endonuclease